VTNFISKLKAMSTRIGNANFGSTSESSNSSGASESLDNLDNLDSLDSNGSSSSVQPTNSAQHPAKRHHYVDSQTRLRKPLYQRWWVWVMLGLGASAGGTAIAVYQVLQSIEQGLPNTKAALTYARSGTMTIRASDGTILQQIGPATRQKLTLDQIPTQLREAFIASEDADFYSHDGVDYQAIGRATLRNISAGEVVEGGSTITQQLARIIFLDQERSLERKLREALLAQKMERDLGKDQILERYLNLVYLGSGAYGVADAAWIYFSKPVSKLTLSEIAAIAGLPPAPSVYSPLVNADAAHQRRDLVLRRMVKAGYITPAQRDQAIAAPLTLKPSVPRNFYSNFPYFTTYVQQQLSKYVTTEQLERGGLTVETTMNVKWQTLAQKTIKSAIAQYGLDQGFGQAALVSINPNNGEIKAIVGGNDFNKSQFNRATQAQRQPGSTFKGIVYTTAIAAGFSPYKPYTDAKFVVDGYEPQNYSRSYRGTTTMRDALINSVNIVAVKVLIDVGFAPVTEMAKQMGINSKLLPDYSLALGASEVNLLEITSAYGTLANEGNHVVAHGIRRIIDRDGHVIYQDKPQAKRAVDRDTAAIMNWMLRGVVTDGTGGQARIDRPVAGKTGTSELKRDLWFIGYVPQLVTGVWLGNDDSQPTYGASSTAARIWHNFMLAALQGVAIENFPDLPQLGGRSGSIKARPLQPRRVSASNDSGDSSADRSGDSAYGEPYRRRSRSDNASPSPTEVSEPPTTPSSLEPENQAPGSEPIALPSTSTAPEPVPEPPPIAPPPVESPKPIDSIQFRTAPDSPPAQTTAP
jgi:penicillin-binding protein 1A